MELSKTKIDTEMICVRPYYEDAILLFRSLFERQNASAVVIPSNH